MRKGKEEEEGVVERESKKKMKRNEGKDPPFGRNSRERRERVQLFLCGQKLKSENIWTPQAWVKFVQNFKYVGILIPRYTIINYHFLTLGKIIYQNNWVHKNTRITRIPLV